MQADTKKHEIETIDFSCASFCSEGKTHTYIKYIILVYNGYIDATCNGFFLLEKLEKTDISAT